MHVTVQAQKRTHVDKSLRTCYEGEIASKNAHFTRRDQAAIHGYRGLMMLSTEIFPTGNVFSGLLNREQLAAQFGVHVRTIHRREKEGLPVVRIGQMRLYDLVNVRAWLMAQESRPTEPKRGRPRKG